MPQIKDLTGLRFGHLTVLAHEGKTKHGNAQWLCLCDCGEKAVVAGGHLTSGHTVSCGCRKRSVRPTMTHGESKSRLYNVWILMRRRCKLPNDKNYSRYGGRGIKVCPEWDGDYEAFRDWALANGYDENAPYGECTLDRKNNDKGYSPDNCRWVNETVQANNRSSNRIIEYAGEKMTLAQFARETGIPAGNIGRRLNCGEQIEEILSKGVSEK